MSDFEDRLAAVDPAAGQPYQHQDLDSLISRITRVTIPVKGRAWHNFQLKIASTLVASALVTAGAIAVLQGSSSLPVLALQSTNGQSTTPRTPGAFTNSASGAMEIYAKFDFSAGPALDTPALKNNSYQLLIPSSASNETSRVAAIFGIAGSPLTTSDSGTDWTATDASGSSLQYVNSGVPQWTFSANALSNSSVSDLPSRDALESDVQSYLTKLGYGYSITAPSFGTTTTTNTASASSTSTEDVTYNVDVDNVSTDQYVNFSVDAANQVVSASGPAFSIASTPNYPLQSFNSAVDALNAQQQSKYPASSPTPETATSGVNSTGTTATSVPPSGPPIVDVTLNSASLTLETYQLTNGSVWLLPVYDFVGTETGANGSTSSGNWFELALDPSYVQNGANVSTHGVINY